jgi:hypothetical protein
VEALRDAGRKLADSSSGSWIGWHSRMYYGDFDEPPVAETWDAEWGGLHRFSPQWQERTLEEVQHRIETTAGTTLAATAAYADRVRRDCEPLWREVLEVMSPISDIAGFSKEAELLQRLTRSSGSFRHTVSFRRCDPDRSPRVTPRPCTKGCNLLYL